jgi:hypothetical protein
MQPRSVRISISTAATSWRCCAYNAQVAVDAKHKLIVAQEVTNTGSDLGLLAQTAGAAKEVLGVARIDAVADKGYYKGEDIQACEEAGIDAYVLRPQRGSAVSNGLSHENPYAGLENCAETSASGDFRQMVMGFC